MNYESACSSEFHSKGHHINCTIWNHLKYFQATWTNSEIYLICYTYLPSTQSDFHFNYFSKWHVNHTSYFFFIVINVFLVFTATKIVINLVYISKSRAWRQLSWNTAVGSSYCFLKYTFYFQWQWLLEKGGNMPIVSDHTTILQLKEQIETCSWTREQSIK